MKKSLLITALILLVSFISASCKQLDVVGQASITSFNKVLNTIPDNIKSDASNGGWSLSAPDHSARFIWSKDLSQSPLYDIMIEFDAKPFIDAGLNVSKLPNGMIINDKILIGTKLDIEILKYENDVTPIKSYENIVDLKREYINYHSELDHFGIDLGGGNAFEWAKDMDKNDLDIVFALNPQEFIDAGVDPENVEGWVFAKIKTMNSKGKMIETDKLIKAYNLN